MTRRPQHTGFTLVELLVSLTLVAIVSAMAFGSINFGARVWERNRGDRPGILADRVIPRLAETFQRAYTNPEFGADFARRAPFLGRADEVRFITIDPSAESTLTAWAIGVHHDPGDTWRLTARRWATVSPDIAGPVPGVRPVTDIGGLDGLSIAYAPAPASLDAQPDWRAGWPRGPKAPALIRFRWQTGARLREQVSIVGPSL